jgi:uncharacterized protein (DUF433 family)
MNPDIIFGKPMIKGTRITVELVLRNSGGGITVEGDLSETMKLGTRRSGATPAR